LQVQAYRCFRLAYPSGTANQPFFVGSLDKHAFLNECDSEAGSDLCPSELSQPAISLVSQPDY
jgi:hypothetical protein